MVVYNYPPELVKNRKSYDGKTVADIVRQHREKLDGSGYPQGPEGGFEFE